MLSTNPRALFHGFWVPPCGMADCYENGCAKGTLECGGSTPPLASSSVLFQGGVEPPQSKALRAFSCAVASRRLMRICGETVFYSSLRIAFMPTGASISYGAGG